MIMVRNMVKESFFGLMDLSIKKKSKITIKFTFLGMKDNSIITIFKVSFFFLVKFY